MGIEKKNLKWIRQKVGLVFQNPDDQLFCPTVFDDVAFGPRNMGCSEQEVNRRVRESLKAVGLEGVEGKSAFHLSFGQKKRAALATILSMDAEIMALDEPASNLDPRARKELLRVLKKIDCTQIIVTHDLDLVRSLCDRIVVISKGKCAAKGKSDEILSDTSFLEAQGLA
jgi:cobalt/nickel transport system ATP-binding protein